MPRYELSEGSSNKFWEIELSGSSFTTTYGKIGSSGTTTIKQWPDAATAKKEHDKLVTEKTKKGYALVEDEALPKAKAGKAKKGADGGGGSGENAALAKEIDADPSNADAWSVYADWLQAQGDSRGELGVTQEELRASPKDKGLIAVEKKLLKEHAAYLVGKFLTLMRAAKTKPLPSVLAKHPLEPEFRTQFEDVPVQVFWRSGFFEQLTVGDPGEGAPEDAEDSGYYEGGTFDIPALIADLMSHPSARFLQTLRLGLPMDPEDGEQNYDDVIKVLVKHPATARLRNLYIGDIIQEQSEISWIDLGDLSKLWPKLPNLRTLTLRGGSMSLGKIDLPELRELTIISGGLDKKSVAAIANAKWPKLEKLELWTGSTNYGGDSTIKDLAPILAGKNLPALTSLGICNCEYTDDVARALPASKILSQISVLDLSAGTLGDDGVTAMLEHVAAFQHLRKLDLSGNFVGKTSAAAAKLCKAVRTRPQRTPDNYDGESRRYVMLGE